MSRMACLLLVLLLPAATGGCAMVAEAVVQGMLEATFEAAFESKEDRHIRKDFQRHRQGDPLKHHHDLRDLRHHQRDRDFHRQRFGGDC